MAAPNISQPSAATRRIYNPNVRKPFTWTPEGLAGIQVTDQMIAEHAEVRDEVFHTNELLEQIFLQVPSEFLWTCQRVNRHFREVITDTVTLRPYWKLQGLGNLRARFMLSNARENVPAPAVDSQMSGLWIKWRPARLCPMLCRDPWQPAARYGSSFRLRWVTGETLVFQQRQQIPDLQAPDSWREMSVTLPPCFKAEVLLRFGIGNCTRQEGSIRIKRTVENDKKDKQGLKLGDLILRPLQIVGRVDWLHGKKHARHQGHPDEILRKLEAELGAKRFVDQSSRETKFKLEVVVTPDANEWCDVN